MPPTNLCTPSGRHQSCMVDCVQSFPFTTQGHGDGERVGEASKLKAAMWVSGLEVGGCELIEKRNMGHDSTPRGLHLGGETPAMIAHNQQEVNKAVLGCVTATAIQGGGGQNPHGNYGH